MIDCSVLHRHASTTSDGAPHCACATTVISSGFTAIVRLEANGGRAGRTNDYAPPPAAARGRTNDHAPPAAARGRTNDHAPPPAVDTGNSVDSTLACVCITQLQ